MEIWMIGIIHATNNNKEIQARAAEDISIHQNFFRVLWARFRI